MSEYGLALGSTLAGKYKIVKELGAGGMGTVYLAENLDIGREVAIKVLHATIGANPEVRQRFRQEARTSALIKHPGIVDVLDMGETDNGQSYIVMEKLDGQTLGARLKQRGKLSVEEAVSVIAEALDAIGAAHDKGVVHRDLKPDNLFLVWHPRWAVKILDFGISRFLNADDVRLTASNTLMGSVLYMPPEQARDARAAGPPADLYALGATLYHALAGQPPFIGESYTEVLSRVISDPPAALGAVRSDVPPALASLVMKLLEKNPADRPATAADVRAALLAIVPAPPPLEPPIANTRPGIGGFSDTAIPVKSLAETADASTPPSRRIPSGATSQIVGEVTQAAPTTPPAERRRTTLVLAGALALAAGVTAIALNVTKSPVTEPSRRDAATDTPVQSDAPAVVDAALVTDATTDAVVAGPADAGPRRRIDAGTSTIQHLPDAAVRAAAKPDAAESLTPLQPLPE